MQNEKNRFFLIRFPPESTFLLFELETNREPLNYRRIFELSNFSICMGTKLTISQKRRLEITDIRLARQRVEIMTLIILIIVKALRDTETRSYFYDLRRKI